jgi:hypothetical protein
MIPVFVGPAEILISNNIQTGEFPVRFENSEVKIFDDITHDNYFVSEDVVRYVNNAIK